VLIQVLWIAGNLWIARTVLKSDNVIGIQDRAGLMHPWQEGDGEVNQIGLFWNGYLAPEA
jgi:hypothetical protein